MTNKTCRSRSISRWGYSDSNSFGLQAPRKRTQHLLGFARERLSPEVFARLQAAMADFEDDPSAVTSRIGGWLSKGLLGLVSLGLWALGMPIIPFFVYYLLLDMSNLRRIIEEHIPERHRGAGRRLLDEVGDVAPGYVRGRFLMALIMAAIFFLAPAPATPDGDSAQWRPLSRQPRRRLTRSELWRRANRRRLRRHERGNLIRNLLVSEKNRTFLNMT
jgi:AI-2E family transporter